MPTPNESSAAYTCRSCGFATALCVCSDGPRDPETGHTTSAATVHPWQRPLLAVMDRLREAGPGSKVKLVVGRKRDYLIVTDKDGRPVE